MKLEKSTMKAAVTAFTAENLGLSEHTYPVKQLQDQYPHLRGIPLEPIDHVCPLVLIGSDYAHLITPLEPVIMGPPGGPVAIQTRLGWTLQGPASLVQAQQMSISYTLTCFKSELFKNVERLWQIDTLPHINEKTVTRSKQDKLALDLLQLKTVRVDVDGVMRYATPLLRAPNIPVLHAPKEAVLPRLRATERRLFKDPKMSAQYQEELDKLVQSGFVNKIPSEQVDKPAETWYFPHHMVEHNNKPRVVFDCSFEYMGLSLNKFLLPGPVLGPSLLGVLLRFRQQAIAICGDIKGMFHQVRLRGTDPCCVSYGEKCSQTRSPASMNGKFCHLERLVAHAVPPMQFRHTSKITLKAMRRSYNLSNSVFM